MLLRHLLQWTHYVSTVQVFFVIVQYYLFHHQLTGFLSGVNTDIARAQRFQQIPVMPEMVDPQVVTDITEKALRRLETAAGTA